MILRLPQTVLCLEQGFTIVFNFDQFPRVFAQVLTLSVVTQFRTCVYTFALYSNKSIIQILVSLGLRLIYPFALILVVIVYVCGSLT